VMKQLIVILILLLKLVVVSAQTDSKYAVYKKSLTKKNLVIAGLVVQQSSSSLVEYKWWWQDSSNAFHFEHDGVFNNYSFGMDKIGHAFVSHLCYHAIHEAMTWAEFTPKQTLYTSIALPAFWALSIEIGDAFSPYGFSVPDLAANFAGIGYGVLQHQLPFFKNIAFKLSYYPRIPVYRLSSNYDDHIYWLSFNMHNLLPGIVGHKWPEVINLAAGYSIEDYNKGPIKREFVFGIDINLAAIKTKSKGLTAIKNVVNLIHLPSPGVKVTREHTPQYKVFMLN
jgi:hypothetical protein